MKNIFSHVGGALHPRRTYFDLSHERKFSCNMAQLIPVLCEEMVPGDVFKIANQSVVRFQPLVAPILHEINQYVHYFFVPYRLLWDEWEDFITGGVSGNLTPALPKWDIDDPSIDVAIGSLWDYMGLPIGYDPNVDGTPVMAWPQRAYNFVYNEYYRDETLMGEVSLQNNQILNRCWEKDYFTSALPWQQRGIAPSLPISGTTSAIWSDPITLQTDLTSGDGEDRNLIYDSMDYLTDGPGRNFVHNLRVPKNLNDASGNYLNNNVVNLANATTFDVADMRLVFQIQKWMERNARCGARYTEFLRAHHGVSPRDERLQRPEYIGGSKSPIIISEVLQTSQTSTQSAQGNLAGHGISLSNEYCGTYHAQEYGLVIGIMSIMPRSAYQQGINRQWIKRNRYDFYFPEFANLSEQEIFNSEICAIHGNPTRNEQVFGFQGRYDEMRYKPSLVSGQLRTTLDYWHLGRVFDPANPPSLNSQFVTCNPRKDVFAVQDEDTLIVSFGNVIKAFRPLPYQSVPGLIDHN